MSGKLIMKRKLDKNQAHEVLSSEDSSSGSGPRPKILNDDDSSHVSSNSESNRHLPPNKRIRFDTPPLERCDTPPPERCDTPPPEPDDGHVHQQPIMMAGDPTDQDLVNQQRNRHLLEAIQAKMLELQRELDEFEEDFDNYNEDDYYNSPPQQNVMSEHEAEALGFAMCAQETILFLQREGISSDSLLYTRLRDALVGRTQNDHAFQI